MLTPDRDGKLSAYLVFMRDSSVPPEPDRNPRRAAVTEYFDEVSHAQFFAETAKNSRDFVTAFKRLKGGELEQVEEYREGRKSEMQEKE